MEMDKRTIAIICLTVIAVFLIWKDFPRGFIWSVITLIAFAAGIQAGTSYVKAERIGRKGEIRVPFYYRKLTSSICYLAGIFLLGEHLWTHGTTWDWTFPPGHELYGLIIIIAGILIGIKEEP